MRYFIIAFLLVFSSVALGQTVGQFRYDTVKIYKVGGTTELILQNKTKDTSGFLFNLGNGLTEFRRPRQLNDSTLRIGIDTFILRAQGVLNNYPTSVSLSGGTLTINRNGLSAITTPVSTTNITEGTNLYYTNARARLALSSASSLLTYNNTTGVFDLTFTAADTARWGGSTGLVTSVSGTANRITITGTTTPVIDISGSYVGQASITTLGTITTGVWNGTPIANANLANSTIGLNTPGFSGTAPNWTAVAVALGNNAVLNIPMASATGVTAGLISKTDYDAFTTGSTGFATIPQNTIVARTLPGTGVASAHTGTQITTLLSVFTSTDNGVVPNSNGCVGCYIDGDQVWKPLPAGGGTANTLLGSGFRPLVTASQGIKTFFGSNTITIDSSSNSNALTWNVDTTTIATKTDIDLISASLTSTLVTEKKIYYRKEELRDKAINTTTGAITTSAGTNISDYIPIEPSTNITIRATYLGDPTTGTTSLPDITIYGWTYDASFTAISEIRSSGLIGTQLNSYAFTTPSNAAYMIIYVKYASEDMRDIMRIESTSTITYVSPVSPALFAGTVSGKINAALRFARFTTSPVLLTGVIELDSAIIVNSGNILVLRDAHIKLGVGAHDNFIRNEAVKDPATHIFARGNRDIKIIGVGRAILEGANEDWGSDAPSGVGTERWRSHGVRFANVNGFHITGLTFKATNANALDLEQSRYGAVTNIDFEQGLEHPNQGGVEIIRGSHHILVENIRGTAQDDIVAMNNILGNEELHILGTTVYDQDRTDLDMFAITVKNIVREGGVLFTSTPVPLYGNAIRMLTSDHLKLHDVTIDGISGYANIFIQSPFGGYELTDTAVLGDVYNIAISNTEDAPIYIFGPGIQNSTFWNVAKYDVTGTYQTVIPPDSSTKITRKYYDDVIEYNSNVTTSSWVTFGGSSQWNNVPGGIDYTAGIAGIQTAPVTGYSLSLGDGTASSGKLHMNYDPTIGANSAIVYSSAGTPRWSFGGSDDGAFGGTNNTAGGRNFYVYDGASGYRLGLNASGDLFVGASPSVYGMKITQAGALSINSNAYTFPTTAGTANQVMAMPASGTQLVWATAGSGGSSNWTVSGSEIYPTVATEVGIGTTTPNSNLHIRTGGGGTIPGLTVESTTTTEYGLVRVQNDQGKSIRFLAIGSAFTTSGGFKQNAGVLDADNPGGLSIVSRDAAGVIEFYSGGVAAGNLRMQIDANGLIGIGTTSQNRLLHVAKSSNGIEGMQISNVNAGGSAYGILQFENDEAALSGAIIMNSVANTGYGGAGSMSIGTFGARSLGFFTNNSLAVLINSSKAVAFNSSFGTSGQVLTSAGTGAAPTWTTASIPTLQQVLTAGPNLSGDHVIDGNDNYLLLTDMDVFGWSTTPEVYSGFGYSTNVGFGGASPGFQMQAYQYNSALTAGRYYGGINHTGNSASIYVSTAIGGEVTPFRLTQMDLTSGNVKFIESNTVNNSNVDLLTLERFYNSTSPAIGMGVGMNFRLQELTAGVSDVASIRVAMTAVTAGAASSKFVFETKNAGTLQNSLTLDGNGNLTLHTGMLIIATQFTPSSSSDATHPIHTLAVDDNFLYYKTGATTWVRSAWSAF